MFALFHAARYSISIVHHS